MDGDRAAGNLVLGIAFEAPLLLFQPGAHAWIDRVINHATDEAEIAKVAAEVKALCAKFPAPGLRI